MFSRLPVSARVGVIGCGAISEIYLANLKRLFRDLEVVACADLDPGRASALASRHGIPRACPVDALLEESVVDTVLNLTVPLAHGDVTRRALLAGKHVYGEKPLAVDLREGRDLVTIARERGLQLGSAPDTFLGAGQQRARRFLDSGGIGVPVAATAFMLSRGVENWHPNPGFFYEPGGGPLFDMGPYYISAMVNLFGPIKKVTGFSRASFPTRLVTSEPFRGQVLEVKVPTHTIGVLEFHSGVLASLVTSFDTWSTRLPNLEVYGSEGSLRIPDPNLFDGKVQVMLPGKSRFRTVRGRHPYRGNCRGVGLADMVHSRKGGGSFRANGDLALHVLEVMHGILMASSGEGHVEIISKPERPQAVEAAGV